VCEVLGGSPIGEVAARYGTSRQSLHTWRVRGSPTRIAAEVEALICELRREPPRWGARRINHKLGQRGVEPARSRAPAPSAGE
jgi:hypothetical protein